MFISLEAIKIVKFGDVLVVYDYFGIKCILWCEVSLNLEIDGYIIDLKLLDNKLSFV